MLVALALLASDRSGRAHCEGAFAFLENGKYCNKLFCSRQKQEEDQTESMLVMDKIGVQQYLKAVLSVVKY